MLPSRDSLHWAVYCVLVVCVSILTVRAAADVATHSAWPRPPHNLHVVCYVGTWANYRPAPAAFMVEDIDPSLCSHLMYSFVGLDNTTYTIKSLDPWTDLEPPDGRGFFKQMTGLREKNPHLKVILAVGGFNEGSYDYSQMASTAGRRRTFIRSASDFVRKHNFDGLDIDWEFPTKNGGMPEDKDNFVSLVKEMRAEFDKYQLLVTAAFHAGVDTMASAYDLPALAEHLDLLNIMAYDYHGSWDMRTGANAPLYAQDDSWSVVDTLTYIRDQGVPLEKVVLGLGMYGHTFLLVDPDAEGSDQLGAPSDDTGFAGDYTKQAGFMGYNEICLELPDPDWTEYWDNDTGTPYLVNGAKVVSYDNERSIALKVDYAVRFNLGGLMLWSIDTDDFQGDCGGTTYPLLTKINKVIVETLEDMGIDPTATPETTPSTSTTMMSTTTDPSTAWTRPPHDQPMVCYVSTWANYRDKPADFYAEDIQPSLCSHLVYAFAGLDNKTFTIKSLDPWTDLDKPDGRGGFKLMTGLKKAHPHLKVLLAIGGFSEGSESYSQLAASPSKRKVFVLSVVAMLKQYDFDGLDFDWEFPGERGGTPEDRVNFVTLIQDLRKEFDKNGGLILTAALHAAPKTIDIAYDIPALSRHLDLLHVMAYDYHGSFDKRTGSNAPLYAQPDGLSVVDTLEYLREKGARLDKVVLGLPMYGHTFVMTDPDADGSDQLGAPSDDVGFPGPYTKQDGFMGYHEICLELSDPGWTQYWDNNTGTPYIINGEQVVSYDDEASLTMKVDYALRFGVGGFMTWSIDTDDFQGDCGDKRYPLLKRINFAIVETLDDLGNDTTTTTQQPTDTTSVHPTTTDPTDVWNEPPHDLYMVCYVSTWARYRVMPADYVSTDIDARLCTHLIYAFAGLDNVTSEIISLDPYADEDSGLGGFKNMTGMRKDHPHLKILLAIGGFGEGSEKYSIMAASPEKRETFVNSTLLFLLKYNFDGLDVDWEFPGERGGRPEDKGNFVLLAQELRSTFSRYDLLLTAAIGAGPATMEAAYDLPALSRHLDLLHVMAYDYHGSFDKRTGSNAPLYAQPDGLSVEDTLKYLKENGAPMEIVVLGLPVYGHTFVMTPPVSDQLGGPAKESGFAGEYTQQDGFMGYHEICLELTDAKWTTYWDNATATPYAIQGEKLISYDDELSIAFKVDYAVRFGVGGFMIWSIDTDDFQGHCTDRRYPLLKTINSVVVDTMKDILTTSTESYTSETSVEATSGATSEATTSVDGSQATSEATTRTTATPPPSTTPGAAVTAQASSLLLLLVATILTLTAS